MAALYVSRAQSLSEGELAILGDVAAYNNDGEYISLVVVSETCRTPESAISQATKQLEQWDIDYHEANTLQNGTRRAKDELDAILERIEFARALGYTDIVNDAIEQLEGVLSQLNDLIPA